MLCCFAFDYKYISFMIILKGYSTIFLSDLYVFNFLFVVCSLDLYLFCYTGHRNDKFQ